MPYVSQSENSGLANDSEHKLNLSDASVDNYATKKELLSDRK